MTEQLSKSEPPICCDDVFMKKYVKGCCRLCWKMVIQRPTMEFTCSGKSSVYFSVKFGHFRETSWLYTDAIVPL